MEAIVEPVSLYDSAYGEDDDKMYVIDKLSDEGDGCDVMMISDSGKAICINSSLIVSKATRTTQGNTVFTLKKGQKLIDACRAEESPYFETIKKYRKTKVPATGTTL